LLDGVVTNSACSCTVFIKEKHDLISLT